MTVPREKPISTCRTPLFGLVAPQLGWVPPLRFLLRRRRILRLLSPISTGRLVEVGCGAGALLVEFDAAGFEVVGVESSPRALMVARRLAMAAGGKQQLLAEPGTDWQHSFDLLCAFDVLEHIENDSAALDEWISWLRPGGRCASRCLPTNTGGAKAMSGQGITDATVGVIWSECLVPGDSESFTWSVTDSPLPT